MQRGATLLDAIVGTALMLVVFVGISGVFRLSIDVVSNNKARTGALALSQEQVEYIRSLSYDAVGTDGGIPSGTIPQEEFISLNGVDYTRTTRILYQDDPKDGLGALDENDIIADYKVAKVSVSWTPRTGELRTSSLVTRVSPPGVEQLIPGGTLSINVVNSALTPLQGASVSIVNASVIPEVDTTILTNAAGNVTLIGAPEGSGYQIIVTKSGYSSDQTYEATESNPNPSPGNLTVVDSATTAQTLAIDLTGTKRVYTYKAIEDAVWEDTFGDSSKIASTSQTTVTSGMVHLTPEAGTYQTPGYIESNYIAPVYLYKWTNFDVQDDTPANTAITYHIYYDDNGLSLIPEEDLPGNSTGFSGTPVDLSHLSTSTYSSIKAAAILTTDDPSTTPALLDWSISYQSGPEPLPNIELSMRGNKTIGTNGGGTPLYKYDALLDSGSAAHVTIDALEWDTYTVSIDGVSAGYDIAESCEPQPRALIPGSTLTTRLYFTPHTTHSLRVDIRDSGSSSLISGASVTLSRALYNETFETGTCGQVFFSGISQGTVSNGNAYSLQVSASGYQTYTSTSSVDVSGSAVLSVVLDPN